jgi:predicted double-glycine peptidase
VLTAAAALVLGLATGAAARPVVSLLEIRQQQMTPQKWDISCGAAALATILTYQLHDPVSERAVAEGMLKRTDPLRVKYRGGFSLLDLKRFAQSRGFEADGYEQMSLDDLQASAPLIVPIVSKGLGHFVVFRGVVGDQVVLADPAYGNRVMGSREFLRSWASGIGFVVGRPNQPAKNQIPPRPADFLSVSPAIVQSVVPKIITPR